MESYYVIVPKSKCQLVRDVLRQERLLDKGGQRVDEKDETVSAVPLRLAKGQMNFVVRLLSEKAELAEKECLFLDRSVQTRERGGVLYKQMRSICKEIMTKRSLWSTDLETEIPTHWEKHNDLALFAEGSFKSDNWFDGSLGDDLWSVLCQTLSVRRLAQKSSISNNDFRSPKVKFIFGNDDTWVSRKENGIIYNWDIARSMFSAGNITEKMRVAKFDCRNEVVVDLFSGIGYFTLPFLVHAGAEHVHACEWNPAAIEALKKNLKANNVEERCTVYPGDNRVVCPRGVADRVNLGLLPTAEMSFKTACLALKPKTGGTLHIHGNVRTEKNFVKVRKSLSNVMESATFRCDNNSWRSWCIVTGNMIAEIFSEINLTSGWIIQLIHLERVKSFAPHVDHLVLDVKCCPDLTF